MIQWFVKIHCDAGTPRFWKKFHDSNASPSEFSR